MWQNLSTILSGCKGRVAMPAERLGSSDAYPEDSSLDRWSSRNASRTAWKFGRGTATLDPAAGRGSQCQPNGLEVRTRRAGLRAAAGPGVAMPAERLGSSDVAHGLRGATCDPVAMPAERLGSSDFNHRPSQCQPNGLEVRTRGRRAAWCRNASRTAWKFGPYCWHDSTCSCRRSQCQPNGLEVRTRVMSV